MYEYNFDILRSILQPLTGQTYGANTPAPINTPLRVSAKSLGLILEDATGRDWMLTLMYVRFATTVAAAGQPVAMSNNATYGNGSVTSVHAAAQDYLGVGISCHAVVAAGDYGFIQIGGLNGWTVTAAAAAVAVGDVLHWDGTTILSVAATDANRLQRIALAHKADADGGVLPVGTLMIAPVGLGAL